MGLFGKKIKLGLLLLSFTTAKAQDIDFLKKSETWLWSNNPTAIKTIGSQKFSIAEVYGSKSNGKFRDFYESDNSLNAGIRTESFYQHNDKLHFHGKIDYNFFSGKNMGGSVFIDPSKNAFDILELSENNKGKKKTEIYTLNGGVSYKAYSKLTIGANINYQTANYTKLKDLRHFNKILDLKTNLGATYQINKSLEIGTNYIYDRRIESVGFGIYGNTDTQYLSLISFGPFWGRTELFSESGYTSETNPMINHKHSWAFQSNYKINTDKSLLVEAQFSNRKGYFGKRGTASITHTEHSGNEFKVNAIYASKKEKDLHQLNAFLEHTSLQNFEKVYRRENTTGGASAIVYYGQNKVLNRDNWTLGTGYTFSENIINHIPHYAFHAGINYNFDNQNSTLYPFFRKRDLAHYNINLSMAKNGEALNKNWNFALEALYQNGSGTPYLDGSLGNVSTPSLPTSKEQYLWEEYEFKTASQVSINPKIRYVFDVSKVNKAYIEANLNRIQAFNTSYLGNSFTNAQLILGCKF